jgi:hypothetical protein
LATIRWVALAPLVVAAWCAVALVSMHVHGRLEHWLCPPDQYWDNSCYDFGALARLEVFEHFAIGSSAIVVLLVAVLIAPSHRRRVTWATFAVGAVTAGIFGIVSPSYAAAAISAGLLGAFTIDAILRRQQANPTT